MKYEESLKIFLNEAREVEENIRKLVQKKFKNNYGNLTVAVSAFLKENAGAHRFAVISACNDALVCVSTQVELIEPFQETTTQRETPRTDNRFVKEMNSLIKGGILELNNLRQCLEIQFSILTTLRSSLKPNSPHEDDCKVLFVHYKEQLKIELGIYRRIQTGILSLNARFKNPVEVAPVWTQTDSVRFKGVLLMFIGLASIASMPITSLFGPALGFPLLLFGTEKSSVPRTTQEEEFRDLSAQLEFRKARLGECIRLLSNMLVTLKKR